MSPDTNHNELTENPAECFSSRIMNGVHKEAVIPEELLSDKVMHHHHRHHGRSIATADVPGEAKTSVDGMEQEQQGGEDEERIQEYLRRSDTAVIYPEPVGRAESGKFLSSH